MALADSLLSAIVRADGDALVMHVGERPYVVVGTQTINISTHGLHLEAMAGMLTQLLPADAQGQLEEFGAVEYKIPFVGDDRFTIVAARGGDDIWIEIRRRRGPAGVVAPPSPPPAPAVGITADSPPSPIAAAPEPAEVQPDPAQVAAEPEHVVATPAPVEASAAESASVPPLAPVEEPAPVIVDAQLTPVTVTTDAQSQRAEAPAIPEPEPAFEPPAQTHVEPVAAAAGPVHAEALAEPVAPPPPLVEPAIDEPLITAASVTTLELLDADDDAYDDEDEGEAEDDGEEIEIDLEPAAKAVTASPAPTPAPIGERASSLPVSIEPYSDPEPLRAAASIEHHPHHEPAPIAASIEREPQPKPEPVAPVAPVSPVSPVAPATALPLTRTVRIEVPPRAAMAVSTRSSSDIERLLRTAVARGAASLILTSESRPWMRVEGDLRQMDAESPLSRADIERAILDIVPESGLESVGKGEATEWISEFDEVGRVRCTTFIDHRGPGVLLRMIATRAATAEQLGLSRDVQALATESQGLVLIAGSRGNGKSTLMSALVDLVNKQRAEFVITLERQIRLVHDNKLALISQREIRGGADESVASARAALRENPDVLVVDDLVSPHMVPLLLTAASEGLLVFVSLTSASTADAITRFIELAPPEMRKAVQNSMAESFRGAVGQVLLKKAGGGLLPAREMMLATAPVTRVIGEGQLDQLPSVFESGRNHGMVSFTDALVEFVRSGIVDIREAFRKAPDRHAFVERLKHAGVDTTMVERLT